MATLVTSAAIPCPCVAAASARRATTRPFAIQRLVSLGGRAAVLRSGGAVGRAGLSKVVTAAQEGDQAPLAEKAAVAAGAVFIPITAWSLYALKTTGCGLPPGPGGSLGAIEGVSYLALLAVVGWSVATKVKTGSGLPAGKFGLLGAVEGFAYLILLAGVGIALLNLFGEYGFIPSALPDANCFGT